MKSFDETLAAINKIKNKKIKKEVLEREEFLFKHSKVDGMSKYSLEIILNTQFAVITKQDNFIKIYNCYSDGELRGPVLLSIDDIKNILKNYG